MLQFKGKNVLVIGLGPEGRAACTLVLQHGGCVTGMDLADTPELRAGSQDLKALGIDTHLGVTQAPKGPAFDTVVMAGETAAEVRLARELGRSGAEVMSALDVGARYARCLLIAVAGGSGKSTTAALIKLLLETNHRKTAVAGSHAVPFCALAEESNHLDYIIVKVSRAQLACSVHFRPAIAVVTNVPITPEESRNSELGVRNSFGALFKNQQLFDWTIIQSEALDTLLQAGVALNGKVIRFSASDATADLVAERGWLLGRMEGWSGPLLDMDHCRLRGVHNAENLMAALATGRVLRLPLEAAIEPLKAFEPPPHTLEPVNFPGEIAFLNDARSANLHSLCAALESIPLQGSSESRKNVFLITFPEPHSALEFDLAGPVISRRVKRVFLVGKQAENASSYWTSFTPCTVSGSLIEAVTEAAKNAACGDAVLFSPACSEFKTQEDQGEEFYRAVKSISGGAESCHPKIL